MPNISGKLPTGITSCFFDECVRSFCKFLEKLNLYVDRSLMDALNAIDVQISDVIKESPYHFGSVEDALLAIAQAFCINNIEVLRIIREGLLRGDSVESIADTAYSYSARQNCSNNDEFEEYVNAIRVILDSCGSAVDIVSNFGSDVAGEYVHGSAGKKHIVLYDKVIRRDAVDGKTLQEAYHEVYIHELFHAYHHLRCEEKGSREYQRRQDCTANIIKESLAAFFEWLYCEQHGIFTKIERDWEPNSPISYPYAGAKYFIDHPSHGLFAGQLFLIKILDLSLLDFDAALRQLFASDPDEFYRVKNHQTVKTVRVISKATDPRSTSVPFTTEECNGTFHNCPIYLLPQDEDEFEFLHVKGYSYTIAIPYADGTTVTIGPVLSNGKPIKSGVIASVQSNHQLRRTNLTGALCITVYINY